MKHAVFLFATLVIMLCSAHAQQSRPLEKFLNPDGTVKLDREFNGTLDLKGWEMINSGPGAPRFMKEGNQQAVQGKTGSQSSTGDEFWDAQFASPGANNFVVALAMSGGNLYAGGWFTEIGGVSADCIARWDGSTWTEVGGGTNCYVYALAVIGTDIYVGGCFSQAGTVNVNRIARWDGSNWFALGIGLNSAPNCLATDGTNLYAGGYFTAAGGASANYIAKWDGSNWTSLGSGLNNAVNVILTNGSDIYAGGYFTNAGGTPAHHIAKWDGSTWSGLGIGLNNPVMGLVMIGTDLYVGGGFTLAGGISANRVAKWDGSSWTALGGGLTSTVFSLAAIGADVYAGHQGSVSRWNGSGWSTVGGGISGAISGTTSANILLVDGSDLYAGGNFTSAGTVSSNCIAKWNGSNWSALGSGNGIGSPVRALAVIGTDVYVGGDFSGAFGLGNLNHIVRWNGSSASTLGSGIGGPVYALTASGSDLYAGGSFSSAGGTGANNISRWNGSTWSALGTGLNNNVYAVAVNGSDVYAGGSFTSAGGNSAIYIARWNGSAWSALGSGMNDTVFALAYMGGYLYAGGAFTIAGGVSANHIARWDGSAWSAIDTGQIPVVRALLAVGSDLYVGSDFGTYIWDGSNWDIKSISGRAIASNATDRYVGGLAIGHLNGSSVSGLGSGITGTVNALALTPDSAGGHNLYVGGSFTKAGGKPSKNFARWNGPAFNVTPSALAFGQIQAGDSAVDSVIVTNTGSPTLEIFSVGSYYGEFSVTSPTSATIPSGGSQKFYVTFSPNSPASINSFVVFNDNISIFPNPVRVSGTGLTPVFTMTPFALFFGTTHPNTLKQDSVLVMNTGNETLEVSTVSTSHPDLLVNPTSASIAPSDTQVFHVDFSPSAEYFERTDTIIFASNYPVSPIKLTTYANNWAYVTDTVQDGWNLVSVPFSVQNYHVSSIFQFGAPSSAFAYVGQYQITDTLEKGPGYWIKFTGSQIEYLTGAYTDRETVDVNQGWNIIGSIPFPISVESIGSIPGGIVTTNFYGYLGGYFIADSIRPGKGYWVKVNQNGKLILSLPTETARMRETHNRIRIAPGDELPPPPPQSEIRNSQNTIPKAFALEQNFPNPFNPSTVIHYQLPTDSYVTLKVYDVLGQVVATLIDELQGTGYKSATWDASLVPSGVYFYKLQAGSFLETKKMLLLK